MKRSLIRLMISIEVLLLTFAFPFSGALAAEKNSLTVSNKAFEAEADLTKISRVYLNIQRCVNRFPQALKQPPRRSSKCKFLIVPRLLISPSLNAKPWWHCTTARMAGSGNID